MLTELTVIIVLYTASYIIFKKNPTFLKIKHWVDLVTLALTLIFVIIWIDVFDYSVLFFLYIAVSFIFIVYLILRLKKSEFKKSKAEETIKILKDEEKVLEDEIANFKNQNEKPLSHN